MYKVILSHEINYYFFILFTIKIFMERFFKQEQDMWAGLIVSKIILIYLVKDINLNRLRILKVATLKFFYISFLFILRIIMCWHSCYITG